MKRTRLLPLFLVIAVSSLPMASQARSSSPTPVAEVGPVAPAPVEAPKQSLPKLFVLPAGTLEKNDGLCFTIRESKFTGKDLESSAPKASGYSTCVAASALRMKNAVAVPAR